MRVGDDRREHEAVCHPVEDHRDSLPVLAWPVSTWRQTVVIRDHDGPLPLVVGPKAGPPAKTAARREGRRESRP